MVGSIRLTPPQQLRRLVNLNYYAGAFCRHLIDRAAYYRIAVHRRDGEACVLDCGVDVAGGLEAGRVMANVAMAGLGRAEYVANASELWLMPGVTVRTDHPVAACLASQHPGWQIDQDGFTATASGPMRAAAGTEPIFQQIGNYQTAEGEVVGVLEAEQLPPPTICRDLAARCGVEPAKLTLLVAPPASAAGTVLLVARSVAAAMHKLATLDFDLACVESAFGVAPMPPVATSNGRAIRRTADAILYGSQVTLWVRGEESMLGRIGHHVPSGDTSTRDRPFGAALRRLNHGGQTADSLPSGPAVVTFFHLDSGRSFRFGRVDAHLLQESFTL
ncbi:MAG: methenyltetrahydromethanopterin cyclohydrolase [Planctomycetes bacterium]|nr:methenyltetrahydromethanopterin cyclohydrolase [Planctomycetota bacterium]